MGSLFVPHAQRFLLKSTMPGMTKPLQTSGAQLKTMLGKTGRSLKQEDNWDKLEVLKLLTEQITDKLKRGDRIKLSLADLNVFLHQEGMQEDTDFKGIVSKILQVVHLQYERLGAHVRPRSEATAALDSLIALFAMDEARVNHCFAIEVYTPSAHASDIKSEGSVPKDSSHVDGSGPEKQDHESPWKRPRVQKEPVITENCIAESALSHEYERNVLEDLARLVPVSMLALADEEKPTSPGAVLASKEAAKKEIERILQADAQGHPILLGSDADERRVAFRHVVLLLHPDLGFVSASDPRAIKALDLSLKAFVQSEVTCAR